MERWEPLLHAAAHCLAVSKRAALFPSVAPHRRFHVTRGPSRDVRRCLGCAGGSYLAGTEKRQVYRAQQSQAVRSESKEGFKAALWLWSQTIMRKKRRNLSYNFKHADCFSSAWLSSLQPLRICRHSISLLVSGLYNSGCFSESPLNRRTHRITVCLVLSQSPHVEWGYM